MSARIIPILAFSLIAGCGGGDSGGPPEMPSKYLYVNACVGANSSGSNTYGLAVYLGGALRPIPGFSPVPGLSCAFSGEPFVITRDSKLLYTTDVNGLVAFHINPDGSLTNGPSLSSPAAISAGLVAHPTADFLYASGGGGCRLCDLSVFAINSGTGALNLTSSVTLGSNIEVANSGAITPDGRYLYQSYGYFPNVSGQFPALLQLAGFSIDSTTGALTAVPGSPVSTMIQTNHTTVTSPAQMAIDPTGKFLYASYQFDVVNVGTEGGVAAFSIDANSGALTAVPGSPFSVDGAPNSIAIDASGRFLLVSIWPRSQGNCIEVLSIDPATGALASVPGSPFGPAAVSCGFVAADPSGPFVYAGTVPVTGPPTVFVLSVDQTTGALAAISQAAVPDSATVGVAFIAVTH